MSLTLDYIYGGEVVYQPGELLKPRLLSDYELVYIISGSAEYRVSERVWQVPSGSFVLGLPGSRESYIWDREQRTRHAFFHFGMKNMPPEWPKEPDWPRVCCKPPRFSVSLFEHLIQHIFRHSDWPAVSPSPKYGMMVELLLDSLICDETLCSDFMERSRPEPVRRALKWIRLEVEYAPNHKVTLADIAAAAGTNEKHLCRLFKEHVGHSPSQTWTLLRLQLGLALLSRSNLSVKEIAQRCGFEDALYFTRCFGRVFGKSPSAIRRDMEMKIPPPPPPLPPDLTPRMSLS
jgi:AraC family transcriptional regulator